MRQGLALVFDEVMFGPTAWYTSTEMNGLLAVQDQMGIQVIVDNVQLSIPGGPPTISVSLQTSGDAKNWATKNLVAEVQPFLIPVGQTIVSPYSADPGTLPTLRYARFKIEIASTVMGQAVTAHVKVFVTFRDLGGEIITGKELPVGIPHAPSQKPQKPAEPKENSHIYHSPDNKSNKTPSE